MMLKFWECELYSYPRGFPGPFNQILPSSEPSAMQGTTSSCRRHIWAEAALGQAGGLVLEPFALPWTAYLAKLIWSLVVRGSSEPGNNIAHPSIQTEDIGLAW